MNIIKLLYDLKRSQSFLWVEGDNVKIVLPDKLEGLDSYLATVKQYKPEIRDCLILNSIFSKDDFQKKIIFKSGENEAMLSYAQQRLWFIERYEEGTNAYHLPSVFELLKDADRDGIRYALEQIVARHEVLRSTIAESEGDENVIQKVHTEPLRIETASVNDIGDYEQQLRADINLPFSLDKEYPIRVKFYTISAGQTGEEKTFLLINIHHIATDGWSMDIFERELTAYYEAWVKGDTGFNLPTPGIQYKDYAVWQKAYLTGDTLDRQLDYWKTKLSGYQSLNLPTDHPRPERTSYGGAAVGFSIKEETKLKLRALCRQYGVTLHTALLSSINILLAKYTGQDDIITGSPVANRHHRQTGELIGFFVNVLVNRTLLDSHQSFADLIQQVHTEQAEAQLHQDLPFEMLVNVLAVARDLSRHPVFQVLFEVSGSQNKTGTRQISCLKACEADDKYEVEKFDLTISLDDSGEEFTGQISYATALFTKDSIARLAQCYTHLLDQLAAAPDQPFSRFSLLTPEAYREIVYDWNATDKDYPQEKTIHELFEAQAAFNPDNTALVFQGTTLSYRELNEKSNQLAREIKEQFYQKHGRPLSPDTLIALCADRSLEMVISIIAVLKAGAAYVPIDPGYPKDRIAYLLADTQAGLILSQRRLNEEGKVQLPRDKVIYIDLDEPLYTNNDTGNLAPNCTSANLAYVIYTSGTTGKPKGVMVEHRSVVNLLTDLTRKYKIASQERFLLFASYIFDASVEQMWLSLSSGNTLFVIDAELLHDVGRFTSYITGNQITHLHATPSFLNAVPPENLKGLQRVVFGAEFLSKHLFSGYNAVIPTVINEYGPTETTITSLTSINSHLLSKATIANVTAYVLDINNSPVPVGVTGELHLGGAGVARGYLNRHELTNERFIANPFATAADQAKGYTRLYKTGDMVRWLSEGNLEYIGRNDEQVKINGYRIELEEITHAVTAIKGIRQACVLAKERKMGTVVAKYLLCYYIAEKSEEALSPSAIQNKLSEILPAYMIPGAFVAMESFPLTVNGKLDKQALPDPDVNRSETGYVAPVTEIEKGLCKIWEQMLGLEQIGLTDNFFRVGGSSILAIQASHRMSKLSGRNVQVADIFRYKTISQILDRCPGAGQIAIPAVNSDEAVLSYAQQRLWFIERYEEGTNAYHLPSVFELLKEGDRDGIKYALEQVVARHEVLRSTIEERGGDKNVIQRVHTGPLPVETAEVKDIVDYEQQLRVDINRPFDLGKEYPIRVKFYTIRAGQAGEEKTFLLINIHHIATDGWSMEIFERELAAYYEAYVKGDTGFSLPAPGIQYKDYAVWQRTYLTGDTLNRQLNYWKTKLSGYQSLNLPTDYPRPERTGYSGAAVGFSIKEETKLKLRALCRQYGVTLHTALLSSINILLAKYTGQDDIITGSPVANRHQGQTGELIGFFVNVLVNSTLLGRHQSFAELIQQVHNEQAEAQLHQDLPFEMLVNELAVTRDLSRHPVFQVLFEVSGSQNKTANRQISCLKACEEDDKYEVEKFDLTISLDDSGEELTGQISYATALFTKDTIERLAQSYTHLLDQLVAAPEQPCSGLSLLTTEDYHKIVYEWNATEKDYPREKTLHELFEEQAALNPDNTALVYQGTTLSYRELNEKSNQLAREIKEQFQQKNGLPLSPDTLIALCTDRGPEMVIGIIAVLKAGAAYVPIDPGYPKERIAYLLADTQASLILSQRRLNKEGKVQLPGDKVIYTDLEEAFYINNDTSNLAPNCTSANLAYVIYTSGTTGKPKGVMVEHRSVVNTIDALSGIYNSHSLKATAFTSYVFDVSVSEIFGSLLNGIELHILANSVRIDSIALAKYFIDNKINIAYLPPVLLSQVPQMEFPDLITMVYAGEPCDKQTAGSWSSKVNLFNYYGPTELSIYATGKRIYTDEVEQIGKSIQNVKSFVLDANNNPVPIGVPGELHLGGAGVARGYLNQPELTNERFIGNPFATAADKANGYTRLYKTGDLVRWLPDGNLEYIGRNDEQVKINGYRIELAEVVHAITAIKGIKQACVLAKERKTGTTVAKYLVCYYVAEKSDEALSQLMIQNKLSEVLPSYMVPATFVAMESFPLTVNGKLDKGALPDPDFTGTASYVKPGNDLEIRLCRLYGKILALPSAQISTHQNFFEIGGNSILTIQLKLELNKLEEFKHISVADIFKYNTINKLIQSIQKDAGSGYKLQSNMVAGKRHEIAIIGVSGAFSGAKNVDELWQLIENQQESISFHSYDECKQAGIEAHLLDDPNFVRVSASVKNVEYFDPFFWSMSVKEARQLDPQYRKFMEHCWFALESAGYINQRAEHHIGVFAGSGNSDYLDSRIVNSNLTDHVNLWEATNSNSKDALATKTAYFLNLSGPALSINTACSTGLVSVVEACKNLQLGACDMALAGGVSFIMPDEQVGYLYEEGMILSKDGHCKTFDKDASGTTLGSGIGVVLLKRLEEAIKDNDNILSVIKGYSTNNDGARKTGYSAPSVIGQGECIITAQQMAGIRSDEIDFVECHGTATHLGDPIEVQALYGAFEYNKGEGNRSEKHKTVLGAVKANIGHTGSAAGVAGLIKVCAMLKNNIIPGQVNFAEPNPELHLDRHNFRIVTENQAWLPQPNRQRLAGVSSFGIGGTNAHVIIGDYLPQPAIIDEKDKNETPLAKLKKINVKYVIPLSANSRPSLEQFKQALITSLTDAKTADKPYSTRDIAFTLQERKEHFNFRTAYCANSVQQLISQLELDAPVVQVDAKNSNKVIFIFPGQGAQYAGMAKELYANEPDFKNIIDQCIKIANKSLDIDLLEIMFPLFPSAQNKIDETQLTQIALFIIEYALAKYLNHLGIYADAYIGHSIGEYVAATLSGVFSLEDAIRVVIARGKLMQSAQPGRMLAINAQYDHIVHLVGEYDCEIACINSLDDIVVSGSEEEILRLKESLDKKHIPAMLLNISRGFHSTMMKQAADEFKNAFKHVKLNVPKQEFISNVSGEIAGEEVATATYWCGQLRQAVQFAQGVSRLCNKYNHGLNFIEAGPGKGLSYFVNKYKNTGSYKLIQTIQLLPSAKEVGAGEYLFVNYKEDLISKLWSNAVVPRPNAIALFKDAKFQGGLPLYQFEAQKCWLEKSDHPAAKEFNSTDEIFYRRSWQRGDLPAGDEGVKSLKDKNILVLINEEYQKQSKTGTLLSLLENHCGKLSFVVHKQVNNIKPGFEFDFSSLANVGSFLNEAALAKPLDIILYISPTIDTDEPCLDILAIKNVFHWAENTGNNIPRIVSVSFDNFEVTGNETLQEKPSIIHGVTKSVPLEYFVSGVQSYHIDLSGQDTNYGKTLLPLLEENPTTDLIVVRGNYLWIPTYQQVKSLYNEVTPAGNKQPDNAVFLITGGLGGLGFVYAHHVAQSNENCTLILLGRTPETNLSGDARSRLSALREINDKIIYSAIDIGLRDALDKLKSLLNDNNISNIDMVLHAAGIAARNVVRDKTYQDIANVVNPKITGIENLIKLSGSIGIGYLVCCSSVSGILPSLGNMEYTAANLYMDEICHRTYTNIQHLLSINLNQVSDTGMSVDFLNSREIKQGPSSDSIKGFEFLEIVQKLMHSKTGKSIALSRYDLDTEYHNYVSSVIEEEVKKQKVNKISIAEDNYTAAHQQIAQIFCEALGMEKISIHDDFFNLGGNSMLAVWVAHRMTETLKWDVKVADIFRLKSIDKLLSLQYQGAELVKPYSNNYSPGLNDLIFIHPGFGGAEVYQNLAELLQGKFNCVGIDNYNIYNEEKISSLSKIAGHYLAAFKRKYPVKEPINLLGWSLGGLIALEMTAILEKEGYTDINITLLDSFIQDDNMLGFLNKEDHEAIRSSEKNMMLMKYDQAHVEKVFSAFYAESALARTPVSSYLTHANIVLFKAGRVVTYNDIAGSAYKNEYIKKLKANNIDQVADKVEVFNLDCQHDNILETNSRRISDHLLSGHKNRQPIILITNPEKVM